VLTPFTQAKTETTVQGIVRNAVCHKTESKNLLMKMKTALLLFPILLVAAGCSSTSSSTSSSRAPYGPNAPVTRTSWNTMSNTESSASSTNVDTSRLLSRTDVDRLTSSWKAAPQKAAKEMVSKYGPPTEATAQSLVWQKPGTFKRIELINEEIEHNFPVPHKDCLRHIIEYKVPPEKFSDLAQFDGSVIAERTAGELSARCDSEAHNLVALNLAYQVLTGTKSVDDARSAFAEIVMAEKRGDIQPIAQQMQFLSPTSGGEDPDKPFTLKAPGETTPRKQNDGQNQQPQNQQQPFPRQQIPQQPEQPEQPEQPQSIPEQPIPEQPDQPNQLPPRPQP
jgi:hypothetical protein